MAVGAAVQPVLQAGHVAQACIASLQQLILNGVAWVAKLLYRLQSMFYIKMRALLGKPSLRLNPQQESGGSIPSSRVPVGISAQPQAASVATWAPQPSGTVTNRGSSGRYTSQARSDGQTCTSHSTGTTTMLVSTQQPMPPTPNGKASPWQFRKYTNLTANWGIYTCTHAYGVKVDNSMLCGIEGQFSSAPEARLPSALCARVVQPLGVVAALLIHLALQ